MNRWNVNNEKLNHCIKRLPELISLLEEAWVAGYEPTLNEDKVENVQDQLRLLLCDITEHNYNYDQCGYWQHIYCCKCNQSKYPALAIKSCNVLSKEMGKMTETEYLIKQQIGG